MCSLYSYTKHKIRAIGFLFPFLVFFISLFFYLTKVLTLLSFAECSNWFGGGNNKSHVR